MAIFASVTPFILQYYTNIVLCRVLVTLCLNTLPFTYGNSLRAITMGKDDGFFDLQIFQIQVNVSEKAVLAAPVRPSSLYLAISNEDWVCSDNNFLQWQLLGQSLYYVVRS